MGFVKFTEVGKHFQPRAIITAGGIVSFNQGARKKFRLDDWSHCIMYFDPEAHTIGFELVNDEDQIGANKLRHIRSEGVDLNARSFLEHFKLRVRRPLSFRVGRDLESDWLTLHLDDAEAVPEAELPLAADLSDDADDQDDDRGQDAQPNPAARSSSTRGSPEAQAVRITPVIGKDNKEPKVTVVPIPSRPAAVTGAPSSSAGNNGSAVSAAASANRSRGVKAMLSELLQD